jgi:hypothetical protein
MNVHEGFLRYEAKANSTPKAAVKSKNHLKKRRFLLSIVQNAEVSDTTDAESSTSAG